MGIRVTLELTFETELEKASYPCIGHPQHALENASTLIRGALYHVMDAKLSNAAHLADKVIDPILVKASNDAYEADQAILTRALQHAKYEILSCDGCRSYPCLCQEQPDPEHGLCKWKDCLAEFVAGLPFCVDHVAAIKTLIQEKMARAVAANAADINDMVSVAIEDELSIQLIEDELSIQLIEAQPMTGGEPKINYAEKLEIPADKPELDDSRCAYCGRPLQDTVSQGCIRGNCAMRPLPAARYDAERAERESPAFHNYGKYRHYATDGEQFTLCGLKRMPTVYTIERAESILSGHARPHQDGCPGCCDKIPGLLR